ncbi:major facilitator superfamily domain-containing protein [Zychaea mexicana]|uniref:major facilitator superfamily domain-containing protein n=1 Tax=Zychaea mexicana TaxID=64656 RepID=UPI0022FDCD23|nr:major facilitator superfamily domain-containing protein [Zychaea mexicana]KAI9484448.1 major facilitator superfamily domain-containing protein [Zychaea mexicana]
MPANNDTKEEVTTHENGVVPSTTTQAMKDVESMGDAKSTVSQHDEKKLLRKLDLRLLPILCGLYLLGYLDRSNIGNAKLGGLLTDLNLTTDQFQWCLSIFYFGYVIFDIPSNIIMKRWRPSFWLATLTFTWGIVAMCMAAVKDFAGLLVCRLMLGILEAGFFPGVLFFLSIWYKRREYGRRVSYFWSFSSLAGAFGGLIAYGIAKIPTHILNTLFIIEGAPSVVLALFAAWYLPNNPETAKFLSTDERELEVSRLATDQGPANDHSWSWPRAVSVFTDYKTYTFMFIYITGTSALQGVTLFLPSIISGMGQWDRAASQALTTPPYFLAFILTNVAGWSSDRFFDRAYHMVGINLIGMAGFLMLMFIPEGQVGVRYFAACVCTVAVYANVPVKVAWFNNNFAGLTRRALASAAIVAIGTIGGAIGGQIYFDEPLYFGGNTIAFCCLGAQTIADLGLRFMLARENKRRDKLTQEQKEYEIFKHGGEELAGDRHPDFRYKESWTTWVYKTAIHAAADSDDMSKEGIVVAVVVNASDGTETVMDDDQ